MESKMSLHTNRHHSPRVTRATILFSAALFVLTLPAFAPAQEPAKIKPGTAKPAATAAQPAPTAGQRIIEQGIAIEFGIEPGKEKATKVIAGEDANVRFKVTDTTTGTPVKGLNLS